jgi:hypothetical protein
MSHKPPPPSIPKQDPSKQVHKDNLLRHRTQRLPHHPRQDNLNLQKSRTPPASMEPWSAASPKAKRASRSEQMSKHTNRRAPLQIASNDTWRLLRRGCASREVRCENTKHGIFHFNPNHPFDMQWVLGVRIWKRCLFLLWFAWIHVRLAERW